MMKNYISKLVQIKLFATIVIFIISFGAYAGENNPLSMLQNDEVLAGIVNPLDSTCYDWRGKIIPCDFTKRYAEVLYDKPIPVYRFIDNKDGTVTDSMTNLIWLKNPNCFGMLDWKSAVQAAKGLKEGKCGPDPTFVLSDGSSAGDWRLPTMKELCTLIDFSRREPALPNGHKFFLQLSAFDDFLVTIEKKPSYNSGCTLGLLLPFFKAFGATNNLLESISLKNIPRFSGGSNFAYFPFKWNKWGGYHGHRRFNSRPTEENCIQRKGKD